MSGDGGGGSPERVVLGAVAEGAAVMSDINVAAGIVSEVVDADVADEVGFCYG